MDEEIKVSKNASHSPLLRKGTDNTPTQRQYNYQEAINDFDLLLENRERFNMPARSNTIK